METLKILQELREGQKLQLKMQSEALEIQRANYELVKDQFDRAKKLQDRAEKIQESSAKLMTTALNSAKVAIPIILLLLFALGWVTFRMF